MLEHQPHAESRNGRVAKNLPGLEPVGVEGCMTCAALSHSREVAREAGVPEPVASANREISNHPHSAVGQGRKLPIATVWGGWPYEAAHISKRSRLPPPRRLAVRSQTARWMPAVRERSYRVEGGQEVRERSRALRGGPQDPAMLAQGRWCPAKWCSRSRFVNARVSARGVHLLAVPAP